MARVAFIPHAGGGPIFDELARRGETLGAEPADYVVVDAQAPGAIAWARSRGVPAIGYHTGLASLEHRLDLNLVLLSRVLQPGAERFDDSYQFVGRLLDPDEEEAAFDWRQLGVDPLIYVSAGIDTAAFDGLTFQVMVDAPQLPRLRLLERATLAITDGEAAMVEDCVRAGVPQMLYPRSADARLLADHVAELGAGLRSNEADFEHSRMRDLAGRVMADPKHTRAVMALSESVRQSGGVMLACDSILAFTNPT